MIPVSVKWLRSTSYLLMGAAGLLLIVSPIFRAAFPWTRGLMSWFLAVGGLVSLLGALTERWYGEYVGLPLLASGFTVFGLLSFKDAVATAPFLATANLCLLLALSAGLMARWKETRTVYLVVTRLTEKESSEHE